MSDFNPTLVVPGLNGSGPGHWQHWWLYKDRGACMIQQPDWRTPDLACWAKQLAGAIDESDGRAWIVAHSFGCLASLCAAQRCAGRIAGLFLVAPADPDKFGVGGELPVSVDVPSVLVASANDPWLPLDKARRWADALGSHLVDAGRAGHINIESGFGAWQDGFDLFLDFRRGRL